MKQLTLFLFALLLSVSAHAQIDLLNGNLTLIPTQDRASNFYFEGNEHIVSAGAMVQGVSLGASHVSYGGQDGLYFESQYTPSIVEAFGVELIAGATGSAGYRLQSRSLDHFAGYAYGIRVPKFNLELTSKNMIVGNELTAVSLRWYLN